MKLLNGCEKINIWKGKGIKFMKKKKIAALLLCAAMVTMTACGTANENSNGNSVESTEQTAEKTERPAPLVDLAKYEFEYSDYVTLADYSAIPVELSETYEVTEEDVQKYIVDWFEYYGPFFTVDETKTVIEEGDIVDVNYVGKLDGVAFDGGTAQNQLIDVSGNCSADGYSSYIEGFTTGLLGAEVGSEVDCDVTFPEDYGNTDLAGKAVVFTFTVNSIQKPIAFEEIDDEFAKSYAGADSVDAMYEMVEEGLLEENAYYRVQEISTDIQDYLLENCTVEIPADFFADLMEAFRKVFIQTNCDGDETKLEEVLSTNYGITIDEAEEEWKEALTIEVKLNFILNTIAKELGIELDTEAYEAELEEYVSYYGLESADTLFESYGYGDINYGERRMKEMHIQSDLLEKLSETAVITIAEPVEEATETVESTETVETTEALE